MQSDLNTAPSTQAQKSILDYAVDLQPTIILLIVIFVFFLLILIYKNDIKIFINRFKKLFLEYNGLKAGFELTENKIEPSIEKNTLLNTPEEENESIIDDDSFSSVLELIKKNEIEQANEIVEKLCQSEQDDDLKYYYKLNFLYSAFKQTQDSKYIHDIKSINENTKVEWERLFSSEKLLEYYKSCRDYQSAFDLLYKTLEKLTDERYKSLIIDDICKLLVREDRIEEASILLNENIKKFTESKAISSLWDTYADVLTAKDDIESASLAKEKTVELNPGNTDTLFSAAYKQSKTSIAKLAALNYQINIDIDPKDANALNNLGVYCDNNGYPIRTVQLYKKSIAQGNTLAMANLAYSFMHAGFIEEARDVLKNAETLLDVHPNVNEAISKLNAMEKEENTRWAKYLTDIELVRPFIRKYADASLLYDDAVNDFTKIWINDKGDKFKINSDQANNQISADWTSNRSDRLAQLSGANTQLKYNLKGLISGRSAKITINKKSDENVGILGFSNVSIEYLAYLNDDSSLLTLIPKDILSHQIITYSVAS